MDTLDKSIREKLVKREYFIVDGDYSRPFGLILKNKEDESVIADIRYCEKKIVLPHWNKIETKEVKNLRAILIREKIHFRDKKN
jgi:hypothetical protein